MKIINSVLIGLTVCGISLLTFSTSANAAENTGTLGGGLGQTVEATDEQAEQHVYELYVDRVSSTVAVYEADKSSEELNRVRTMVCSCGRRGHSTPVGTFRTGDSYEWRYMIDGSYAQYAVRFNGHILFHSVPYYKMSHDSLEWEEYNKLGSPASLGCVRLCAEDAKWIYDNCERGTKVVVFDGDGSDPTRPPDIRRISESSPNRGWDPTDPDEENPWKKRVRR